MANVKITDLSALTNPASTDVLPIVDVGTDVTKKVSIADLLKNAGDGTASAPGIAFDGDSNTGIYRPGPDQVAISTNGSERLRITSDGKVGLGTSNASQKLHIGGSAPGDSIIRQDATTSGTNWEIGEREAGKYQWWEDDNDQVRMTLTSGGLLGIGTTSPSQALNVKGIIQTIGTNGWTTDGDTAWVYFGDNNNRIGGERGGTIGFYSDYAPFELSAGAGSGSTSGTQLITFKTGTSERARIDSSGRLLVGTSTARSNFFNSINSAAFQLEGQLNNAATASIVQCYNANTQGATLVLGKSNTLTVGANALVADGHTLGRLSYQGNDGTEFVEAASIKAEVDGTPGANDMPGRLVFSTTADGASSPTERMRIQNNGWQWLYSTNSNIAAFSGASAGTSEYFLSGFYGATGPNTGTVSLRIWNNGDIQNTNNSYGALSDIKLKENIVDANSQWDDLKALQVRNYNFKEGQTHTQIGLIAQEAELVSPGLVSESPDRDEDGNDLGTVTKSVNYSVLYMKAVKALQEAMERIETLEAKVNALEGN